MRTLRSALSFLAATVRFPVLRFHCRVFSSLQHFHAANMHPQSDLVMLISEIGGIENIFKFILECGMYMVCVCVRAYARARVLPVEMSSLIAQERIFQS